MNDKQALRVLIEAAQLKLLDIGNITIRIDSPALTEFQREQQQLAEAIAWAEKKLEEIG